MRVTGLLAIACALGSLVPVGAQQGGATTVDPSLYSGMRWRNVGPARGGRSIAAEGSDARPNEYWFGATGGGAWKTTDGGSNWAPMTDGKITSSSIGSLAVCQSNPDVVYIGGGETQLRGNIIQGDGVYRSTDGGKTFTHVGLDASRTVSRLTSDSRAISASGGRASCAPTSPSRMRSSRSSATASTSDFLAIGSPLRCGPHGGSGAHVGIGVHGAYLPLVRRHMCD